MFSFLENRFSSVTHHSYIIKLLGIRQVQKWHIWPFVPDQWVGRQRMGLITEHSEGDPKPSSNMCSIASHVETVLAEVQPAYWYSHLKRYTHWYYGTALLGHEYTLWHTKHQKNKIIGTSDLKNKLLPKKGNAYVWCVQWHSKWTWGSDNSPPPPHDVGVERSNKHRVCPR